MAGCLLLVRTAIQLLDPAGAHMYSLLVARSGGHATHVSTHWPGRPLQGVRTGKQDDETGFKTAHALFGTKFFFSEVPITSKEILLFYNIK